MTSADAEGRAEHVWVSLTGRWDEDRAPGLLIGWRQRATVGWEGWVIVAEPPRGDAETSVRQSWVRAGSIRPLSDFEGPPEPH